MLEPMPPLTIKRKDPLVKAVRRNATRQLDVAIDSLTGPDTDTRPARRELFRLESLLYLVRRPLTREVFTRESRVVSRGLKLLTPPPSPPDQDVAELAAIEPVLDAPPTPSAEADQAATELKRRQKTGPDPKRLRLVADLAEMRMRARYWHLPDGGFELLAPGLRQSYQRGSKIKTISNSSDDLAPALARLADQVHALERAWPEMIRVTRKFLRQLEHHASAQTRLESLRPHLQDHPALLARLEDQITAQRDASLPLSNQLFVESPAAFTKRLAGIWNAWRS